METSQAESQTDSYFPKQKRCKRHTYSKTNYNKIKVILFVSLLKLGLVWKENIAPIGSKFFPLRVDPF